MSCPGSRAGTSHCVRRTGRRCSAGPRTGSSVPVAPWIFQARAPAPLPKVAEIRPRPSLCASLTPPSSLCPSLRTMMASTCWPDFCSAGGTLNVAVPVVAGELVAGGQHVLAEVGAVEPDLCESGRAAAVVDAHRAGGPGEASSVPDVAGVEAVVVRGQHRRAGRGPRGAVGAGFRGVLPGRVVEGRVGLWRFRRVLPGRRRQCGQGHRGRAGKLLDGGEAAGRGWLG